MGLFWKRKSSSDFITLGLNSPSPVAETAVEPAAEPAVKPVVKPVVEPVAPVELTLPVTPVVAPVGVTSTVDSATLEIPEQVVGPVVDVAESPGSAETPGYAKTEDAGFINRFRRAISSTRENLTSRIDDAFKGRKQIDAATLEELEEMLIGADIGVQTTLEIIEDVRRQVDRQSLREVDELKRIIRNHLLAILENAETARGVASETATPDDIRPYVIMVVGVNGAGKTTTIGKLAQRIKADGNEVMICAADTFRAAASDQLAIWAERAGVTLIQQKQGTDPAAVLFDSLRAAQARKVDVLIVDTAGRLHNKSNLMSELEKMKRIARREVAGAPHETLLVIDAVTGQNGLSQAREFTKVADVTGLVLTKLDGTARGGIAVAIAKELSLPIRYCGIGEQADDLVVFDPRVYVDGLFE